MESKGRRAKWLAIQLSAFLVVLISLGSPVYGDTVRLLIADDEALAARTQLISSAERQLDLAYFAFNHDAVSCHILSCLVDAARRGVRVRLVIDGMFGEIPDGFFDEFTRCGGKVRVFNPPKVPQVRSFTFRMHDKYIARDEVEMIVGSRNIEDSHFGLACEGQRNYLDVDAMITGESVAKDSSYFECLWNGDKLCPLDKLRNLQQKKQFNSWLAPVDLSDFVQQGKAQESLPALEIDAGVVEFMYDPASEKHACGGVECTIFERLNSARHSILIESPYIITNGELYSILENALRRGVRVRLLTNSLRSTDHPAVYTAFDRHINSLLRQGAEVWEYHGSRILHAKTFVIDRQFAAVTSFNFDPRSSNFDTQNGVLIDDAGLAEQLEGVIQQHISDSAQRICPTKTRMPLRSVMSAIIIRQL